MVPDSVERSKTIRRAKSTTVSEPSRVEVNRVSDEVAIIQHMWPTRLSLAGAEMSQDVEFVVSQWCTLGSSKK